ncbi:uncharacterized protein LOC113132366 [Mastacembelus armatus]|uniref:uncharacterized protein LOC113132366 n=1 Tax=Mastacembelus armatus TaxID=205130 RepID=UPI000E4543D4|nr:uncharacterized protein LOC113132366 [Mastacembelus armatus]
MSETLLMSLLVTLMLQVAAGQYRLVCPTPLIKAAAGDRAVTECHVDPPVNLKTKTVEFSKVDPYEVLLVYRSGEIDPDHNSSRISLSDEDLRRGIVKLQISPVQLSDSGLYKIHIQQLKANCTFDLSVGQVGVDCPSLEAKEGGTVTFECRLDPPVNLSTYTLDFRTADLDEEVYVYPFGDRIPPQMMGYRNRTSLIQEHLTSGLIRLNLSRVQLSDSGPYKCFIPKLKAGCTFNLTVVKPEAPDRIEDDNNSTTTPPVENQPEDEKVHFSARGHYVLIGVGVVLGIIIIIIIIIGIWKHKQIQHFWKQLRGREDQRAEPVEEEHEMKTLNGEAPELV